MAVTQRVRHRGMMILACLLCACKESEPPRTVASAPAAPAPQATTQPALEREPTFKGLPLSHYLDLLQDSDTVTRINALQAIEAMPTMFDEKVMAIVMNVAEHDLSPVVRIVAAHIADRTGRIADSSSNRKMILTACRSIGYERISRDSELYELVAAPCRYWESRHYEPTDAQK